MERHLGVPPPHVEKDRKYKGREVANRIDLDLDTFSIGESERLQRVFFEVVPEEIVCIPLVSLSKKLLLIISRTPL
jgi:hypothetical protein